MCYQVLKNGSLFSLFFGADFFLQFSLITDYRVKQVIAFTGQRLILFICDQVFENGSIFGLSHSLIVWCLGVAIILKQEMAF
jgi:hypothetical protein